MWTYAIERGINYFNLQNITIEVYSGYLLSTKWGQCSQCSISDTRQPNEKRSFDNYASGWKAKKVFETNHFFLRYGRCSKRSKQSRQHVAVTRRSNKLLRVCTRYIILVQIFVLATGVCRRDKSHKFLIWFCHWACLYNVLRRQNCSDKILSRKQRFALKLSCANEAIILCNMSQKPVRGCQNSRSDLSPRLVGGTCRDMSPTVFLPIQLSQRRFLHGYNFPFVADCSRIQK